MEKYKAGTYKQQGGYKSFTPSYINQYFAWENPTIDVLLEQAGRLLGELNAYTDIIPDVNFFIKMNISKEARDSTRIEGTKTELDEVVLPQEEIDPERRDDWEEVQNYIEAMNFAIIELPKIPLSMRLLKEVHKRLLSGVRGKNRGPGEVRKSQNRIGGTSFVDAIFVPPSAPELPELLSDLEKFIHNESLYIPELIKIAITHYQFETIHPFLDGNGRCGRLLIILQLINANILRKPVLYMSSFFEKNRFTYYDSLTRVRSTNDIEQWITFFLNGIVETAQHGIDTFKAIIALQKDYETKILTLGSRTKKAQKLLHLMYTSPIVNVRSVERELEMGYSSANRLLKSLIELNIIEEITGHTRNRLFVLEKYINLFRS
ncbi:MAG: Fic family protein [Candidatus Poribacteria bacterium]|nr:Fic family protein [Candidatus Poribacteria bacterium]